MSDRPTPAFLAFSEVAFGAKTVASEEVDVAFGMPRGKLRQRAGIVSLSYAEAGESEVTLGLRAADGALRAADVSVEEVDWILAASETHQAFPSLAAQLHRSIGARESCGAMDIGGACLGFLYALAAAKAFLESGQASTLLVVTADVHSRTLTPGRVAGEFGGLFGDGASAFLVQSETRLKQSGFRLRDFFFGCAVEYQQAIQVCGEPNGRLRVVFDGDALSRAATARLDECLRELERRSGIRRAEVAAFATHQPNPRLVALVARKVGVSAEKFPLVADLRGNLGPTTCAAALHYAFKRAGLGNHKEPQPIFLASLGPGLLFGAGWLSPAAVSKGAEEGAR